ncbi:hypothetical protein H6P81_020685 [Aristolochia fimbriata]|uniref:Uncharacterized protein n=1 Tax=Aristolochia fimbriata TaxID=158543 RepID=A0AAV7DV65_ARIFI|nr:hypothetical protein H6P81_020685 [Aristolochia fimbriata]
MVKANGLLLPLLVFLVSCPASFVRANSVTEQSHSFSRPDPLGGFKPYNGGFDVKDRHYWSSLIFTGVHGYATAGVWVLGGLGFGIFFLGRGLREEPAIFGRSDSCSFFSFLIILLLALLVIVVSGIIFAANQSFNKEARKLVETLEETIVDVRKNIREVTGAMDGMHPLLLEYDEAAGSRLNSTTEELQYQSGLIRRLVHKNRRSIDLAIQISNGITIGTASASMVLVVAAFGLLQLRWRRCFITTTFIGLLLTALCWVLQGLEFVEFNFIRDACSAFEDYTRTPDNNSLRSVFPCLNETSADAVMSEIGFGVHTVISQVNHKISNLNALLPLVASMDSLPEKGPFSVCDPFSGAPNYHYDPNSCPNDTIPIGEVPKVLNKLECPGDGMTITCRMGLQFMPGTSIDMAKDLGFFERISWGLNGGKECVWETPDLASSACHQERLHFL